MKSLAASSFSATENNHRANQICYTLAAVTGASSADPLPATIPNELCFETLSIDLVASKIDVFSYFQPHLFKDLTLQMLKLEPDDRYSFTASSMLKNQWDTGCGSGEKIEMVMTGVSDFTGFGDVWSIGIEIRYQQTTDTCHATVQTVTYSFATSEP